MERCLEAWNVDYNNDIINITWCEKKWEESKSLKSMAE